MNRHKSTEPSICALCNRTFALKSSLNKHLQYVHGTAKHKCTMCEKYLRTSTSLKVSYYGHVLDMSIDMMNFLFRSILHVIQARNSTNASSVRKHLTMLPTNLSIGIEYMRRNTQCSYNLRKLELLLLRACRHRTLAYIYLLPTPSKGSI